MSKIKSHLETLTDELIVKLLKPKLIAEGYYENVLHGLDTLESDVARVHDLVDYLRVVHVEQHTPGPLSLCDPICRMVDAL